MKRCFVALRLPAGTRAALAELQDALRSEVPDDAARRMKPVKADNLHLTLKFLGDTPDAQLDDVCAALHDAAAAAPVANNPALEGVGAFPNPQRPRAVFAEVRAGRQSVVDLMIAVDTALGPLGFAAETRPRQPHVTLVRVTRAKPGGALTRWIQNVGPRPLGEIDAGHIVLFESELDPAGSIYTPLSTVPMAA